LYAASCFSVGVISDSFKCPKCEKEAKLAERERNQSEDAKRKKIYQERLFEEMGIIKRYWHLKLSDITPTEKQEAAYKACDYFFKNFDEMCQKGQCLVFSGGIGTGKTMFVSALIQSLRGGLYIRAVDISRTVRQSYSLNTSELEVINHFVSQSLLVIDEIGVQMNTEAEALLITDLIDRRYGEMKPTIICTNLNEARLLETLGSRAYSRIMQNGALIPMIGSDQR